MACSHAAACPLFPLLNSSLDGWRRCYCDSQDGWRQCARYQQSLRGQYVPLSLLPNGHDARHLQRPADREPVAGASDRPPGTQTSTSGPTLVELLFEHAPEPGRTSPGGEWPEWPSGGPHPPSSDLPALSPTARHRHEPGPTRPWWKRLAEWMRTPA